MSLRSTRAVKDRLWRDHTAKIQGKQIVAEPEKAPEVIDLMEALRRSVERAKTGNVAAGAGVTEAGGDAGSSPGSGLGGTVEEMGSGPAGR